jgi:hypothetical protein
MDRDQDPMNRDQSQGSDDDQNQNQDQNRNLYGSGGDHDQQSGSRDRMGNTEDQETGNDIGPRTGLPRDPNQGMGREGMPDGDMNPDLENEQKWSSGTSNDQ